MSDELFAQGDIRVSKTIALVGGVSYPINGITAVLVKQKDLNVKALVGGAILAIAGLAAISSSPIATLVCLIIAAVLIFFAFQRPYRLILRTAAGDTQALEDKDGKLINAVRSAIEAAVTQRG